MMSDAALSAIEPPAETQDITSQTDPAVEAKARSTGWVPKEEFTGDPKMWRPAEKWRSPDEQLGAIRKRNETLEKRLAKQSEDFADKFKRMERMSTVAIKAARQEIIDKYETKVREAVKSGDEEALDRAEAVKTKALKNLDDEVKEAEPKKDDAKPGVSPEDAETVEDWKDDNPWFDSNEEMRKFADRKFVRIRRRDADLDMEDVLAEVRKAVEEQFPEEFNKRRGAARVEGGSRDMGGGGGRSTFAGLPAEVRAQADKFIDQGLFLEKGETKEKNRSQARERYAAEYIKDNK